MTSQPHITPAASLSLAVRREVVRAIVMLGLVGIASGVIRGTLAIRERNRAMAATISMRRAELAGALDRQAELLRRRDYLESEAGIVSEARAYGYGRRNELRVMFDEPATPFAVVSE